MQRPYPAPPGMHGHRGHAGGEFFRAGYVFHILCSVGGTEHMYLVRAGEVANLVVGGNLVAAVGGEGHPLGDVEDPHDARPSSCVRTASTNWSISSKLIQHRRSAAGEPDRQHQDARDSTK